MSRSTVNTVIILITSWLVSQDLNNILKSFQKAALLTNLHNSVWDIC